MITVDKNKCPQDHRCPAIRVCPVLAITQKNMDLPIVDNETCIKCQKCIRFCPMDAIQQVN